MSDYSFCLDIADIADEYAKRLQERVDELTLDRAAETLAKYSYVKVVHCKDCKHYIAPGSIHFDDGTTNLGACSIVRAYMVKITPDGFCAWGERKNEDD